MSTVIVTLLVVILIVAVAAFFVAVQISLNLRGRDVNHAQCIAHVSHYVGNEFGAAVLRAAAEDYSSADGQHELKVIANSRDYRHGVSLSIPSIWLNNRADALIEEIKP